MQWFLYVVAWGGFALPTLAIWKSTERPNVAVDSIDWYVIVLALVAGPLGLALELIEQRNRRRARVR